MPNKTVKKDQSVHKGMEQFRATLGNVMTHRIESIEEEVIAKAISKMLQEEKEQNQKLH